MIALFNVLLLLAQGAAPTLEQIRADTNPEHRAKIAVEFAAVCERNAEAGYAKGDMSAVAAELKNMSDAVETAQRSFLESGKTPMRHPGPYKSAELRTEEILVRLGDLERRMDSEERGVVQGPKDKVQEIHDSWFDGIMSRKKK